MLYSDPPKWVVKFLNWLLADREIPVKITIEAQAGMTYHAIANSQEPALRKIHTEIKNQMQGFGWEMADDLVTITVEFNARRKIKPIIQ